MKFVSNIVVRTALCAGALAACSKAHAPEAVTNADGSVDDSADAGASLDAGSARDARDARVDADDVADCAVSSLLLGEACDMGPPPFVDHAASRSVMCDDALDSPPCPHQASEVITSGSGPEGASEIAGVWVDYSGGFVQGTHLIVVGTQGGFPFRLQVSASDLEGSDGVVLAPGFYDGDAVHASLEWFAGDGTCRRIDDVPAVLVVDRHEADRDALDEGEAISLEGNVLVRHEYWDMVVAFGLERSCGYNVSI